MANKKPKYDLRLHRNRELLPSESDEIDKDVAELNKLGHQIPTVTVDEAGPPSYKLVPPPGQSMGVWRMALEQAGFAVVSNLDPGALGFSAKRRVVQGKGWT